MLERCDYVGTFRWNGGSPARDGGSVLCSTALLEMKSSVMFTFGGQYFETQVDRFSHIGEIRVVSFVTSDELVEGGGDITRRELIVQHGKIAVKNACWRLFGPAPVTIRVLAKRMFTVDTGEWSKYLMMEGGQ